MRAVFIHRLPSKISSIAWDPFDEVSLLAPALAISFEGRACYFILLLLLSEQIWNREGAMPAACGSHAVLS